MMPYYNSGHGPAAYNKDGNSSGPSSTSGGRVGGSEPTYMMEHLATFTVTKETGIVYPADGMRRLLQLEKSNGIWSQKMQLRLERNWVLIMDNETGAVMERFPASLIQEPTAFTSRDPMEMYNNILVFTVGEDSGSGQRAEMHIFQCQSVSAQDLVEDLKMLQMGKLVPGGSPRGPRGHIPPPPALPPPEPPLNGVNVREQVSAFNAANNDGQNDISRDENNDEVSSTSSEKYERDVTILNHCFDDIEKFIARLQHAAAASRELERRRRNRKSKKRNLGDGMLTMRAKPPPEMEFIDIFQKFKLSFNLLAKLKAHIHDPNAPELVHFLFTPLALIVDASHDTNYDPNLPSKVVSPLLTREAVNLLINCVTSKETELWHSLGDTWLVPRDQWKGQVPPYHPVFMDGWSPEYPIPEDRDNDHLNSLLHADKQKRDDLPEPQNDSYYNHRDVDESHYSSDYLDYESREERGNVEYFERNYGPAPELYGREERERVDQTRAHSDISVDSIERGPRGVPGHERAQEAWLDDLLARHAKIVQVTYPRTANNDKELTVVRGEYLEILDDSRKWWKARNSRGQVAHVPHTIVTPHNPSHTDDNDVFNNPLYTTRYQRQGHGYNYEDSELDTSTSPGPETSHRPHAIPPPAPAEWVRKERLGKKGEPSISSKAASDDVVSISDSLQSFGSTKTVNSWEINHRPVLNSGSESSSKIHQGPAESSTKVFKNQSESSTKIFKNQSESSTKVEQSQSESSDKIDQKQFESFDKINQKQSDYFDKIDQKQSEFSDKNYRKQTDSSDKIYQKQSEALSKVYQKQSETPSKIYQKKSESSSKIYQKQLSEPAIKIYQNRSESSDKIIPPPPPPPPITAPKSPQEENKMGSIKSTKSIVSLRSMTEGSSGLHEVHQELKSVLTMFREKKRAGNSDVEMHIDQYSNPREVQNWLAKKGFSEKTSKYLKDMTGANLLTLTSRELEHYCGITEGKKLDEELTHFRNASSYKNNRSSELKRILGEFRKDGTANKS